MNVQLEKMLLQPFQLPFAFHQVLVIPLDVSRFFQSAFQVFQLDFRYLIVE